MPLVSVVIPTSNRIDLLGRAIKSVENQTFTDWEIIVVDDASIDMTESIMSEKKSEQIHYIRLHNKSGGAVARNTGIKNSKGDLIAFLDDDDEWMSEKLQKQIDCIEHDQQLGICYTGRKTIRKGNLIFGIGKKYSFRYPLKKNQLKAIMTDNFIGITSSVMIPRTILEEINGFDELLPCLQDYDLYIRIIKKWNAAGINEPLVLYHLDGNIKHVSLTRQEIEFASRYILKKYSDEQYHSLLVKAIKRINMKKMIKSFAYAKEVIFNILKTVFSLR
jgi:glycosyltransferase involved in cell wall biosynthesis